MCSGTCNCPGMLVLVCVCTCVHVHLRASSSLSLCVCACVLPSSSLPTLISQKAALLTVCRLAGRPSALYYFWLWEHRSTGAAATQALLPAAWRWRVLFSEESSSQWGSPASCWPSRRAEHCQAQREVPQRSCCSPLCWEISSCWAAEHVGV